MSCSSTLHTTASTPTFDLQGHRGCRGWMPENTIPAMYKALDLGVHTLEMDVVMTADGEVVVSHEAFFSHEIATHPNGEPVLPAEEGSLNIFRMTYAEVARYDVGLRPHPRFPQQQKMPVVKPLLRSLIDSVEAHARRTGRPAPRYNIEIKTAPGGDGIHHPPIAAFAEAVWQVIQTKGISQRSTLQSFDPRPLQWLHDHLPQAPLALLIEDTDTRSLAAQLEALGFTPQIWSPHYSHATALRIQEAHTRGMKVIPWTVNDAAVAAQLRKDGVDGLITDYPGRGGVL